MQESNKAKTPSAVTLEASITNQLNSGDSHMINSISLVEKSQLTMSSREIAELVESRHDSVKRATERLMKKGVISVTPLVEYQDSLGRTASEYKLIKRDSYIVVAQLCPEFTAKLVDRWQELENQVSQPQLKMPTTKELALMVIQIEEEKEQLLLENRNLGDQIEEMRDDVDAFERIARADGSLNLTSSAKHLQYPPRKFNQLLNQEGWIYRRNGSKNWLGYQDKVKQGLVEHKVTTLQTPDGVERICEQVLITPKGLTKLSQMINIGGLL